MPNVGVISLNTGKLTPLTDTRSDIEKYSAGCRILDNMIPLIYGPVTRRPGTVYRANVADNSVKSKVVPFIFSSTIAYDIEFGDQVINVYFQGVAVHTDISSPYLEADLFQLQFDQSADVMWIVHPSYAPRKLSRVSPTEFTLTEITFDNGPFIERNDIAEADDVTMAVAGYTIATATAGTDTFTIASATDISSQFTVNKRFYVDGSTANDAAYTVESASWAAGTLTLVSNEDFTDSTNDGQIMIAGASVILTASSATFTTGDEGHTGALFKLTQKRLQTVSKGTTSTTGVVAAPIDVKGNWTATLLGNWGMTVEIQRLADGTNWETFRTYVSTITDGQGSQAVTKSDEEEEDNVQYRINVIEVDGTPGTLEATFTVDNSTQDSIFRITATASTISATATAIIAAPEATATKRWAEGAWSAVRGYPSAITFFGERAIYGFTNLDQQTFWLSGVGVFEDFEAGINASDSFALRLPTANRGIWLASLETLAVGTSGDEWRIQASNIEEPLKPDPIPTIRRQTRHGSADIQSMEVNEAILFIDSVARKVREYTFSDSRQKYVSPDLTALAEDITLGGITSAGVQKNPDSIIWFTIGDSPYLISMTYEREQNVVAWAQHPLGGDGIAESVSVTPGVPEDTITLTVKRTIGGVTVRFIEQMAPRNFGSTTDPANAFFVDAGIIDISGSETISGLGHLEGEEVAVLVDGAVHPRKTVSNSQITIDESGNRVVVGLPYTYQVSPMRMDIGTGKGTTHGTIKKVAEVAVSLFATGNAQFGDGIDTFNIDWRTEEPYDSPPALFTGDKVVVFDGGFDTEDNFIISGSDPLPCTVRAIILRTDITGR